jgi:8-oxo-dGTP diphosphatase
MHQFASTIYLFLLYIAFGLTRRYSKLRRIACLNAKLPLNKESSVSSETPKVGIGIIVVNDKGEILIGKRKNSHAPYYSIPGGHMEIGETFTQCAAREMEEETGIIIRNPEVIAITNNLVTFQESGKHYISVALLVTDFTGNAELKEPDKCEGWLWINPKEVPNPQFDASEQSIQCYLNNTFCVND